MRRLRGEYWIMLSCLFFSGAILLVKELSAGLGGPAISLVRFAFGALACLVILRRHHAPFALADRRDWLLRGIVGAVAMVCQYIAVDLAGSGRATLLSDTYPVFVALFGFLLFRTPLSRTNLVGLLCCMIGLVFVFGDRGGNDSLPGHLAGLASGMLGGIAVHYIKRARRHNPVEMVYLSVCLFGTLLCLPAAPGLMAASTTDWLILLAIGALAMTGQFLMTHGYHLTSPNRGSIAGLTEVPITISASALLFGEPLGAGFLIGALILIGGLVVNQAGVWAAAKP
jgi:drug/metabolite transporter (DMT)-like permease